MHFPVLQSFLKWCSVLITSFWNYLSRISRPTIKWLLHRTTGLCELQRVCYCEPAGAHRMLGVEQSLLKSKNDQLQRLVQFLNRAAVEKRFGTSNMPTIVSNAVQAVYQIKMIRPEVHQPFRKSLSECISIIWGYTQLMDDIEELRKTSYNSDDSEHERKLQELWDLLMPGRPLEARVSDSWKEIGFQGNDPMTDFRGMGLLGLENLIYFSKNYSGAALHVLSHSHHPKYGYSFACVGINLTHMSYHMWKDGTAKTHVFNACHHTHAEVPDMSHFHRFYCYLYFEFDKMWLSEKPSSIMDFSRIRDLFEQRIRLQLADHSTLFKLNFAIDQI
nr:EOG090X0AMT [Sida crystallina]